MLCMSHTKPDSNAVSIQQDGKYSAVAEAREERKKKKNVVGTGDLRDMKLVSDLRMTANKFLSRS